MFLFRTYVCTYILAIIQTAEINAVNTSSIISSPLSFFVSQMYILTNCGLCILQQRNINKY